MNMKTIAIQTAVDKFTELANASFEDTKAKVLDNSLAEMYKSKAMIVQGYDDIQNNVMIEFFGVDYYDNVGGGGELDITYEILNDLREEFSRNEYELLTQND